MEVEGSGLAVEALDLSDSIEAVAERQLVKHADAQGRVDAETWDWFTSGETTQCPNISQYI